MGPDDKASHSYNNKKTKRTAPFWNPGGHVYVFSVYMPNYYCFNIVANNSLTPQAVLIRAVEPYNKETQKYVIKINNKKDGKKKIKNERTDYSLYDGPVKSSRCMFIDKSFNNIDLTTSDDIGIFEDNNCKNYEYLFEIDNKTKNIKKISFSSNKLYKVDCSKRINIDYAEEYIDKLWRFYLKDNKYVSKFKFKD